MSQKVNFPSKGIKVVGDLFLPRGYTPETKYPAVVIAHPMTGVKEQAPNLYATVLAPAGFIILTFDAAYQGESEGQPRYLEDPTQRAEDIRAAVTFLSLRQDVDPERIGALGICASGGYVQFAAQTDLRIKAVATVSGVCTGRMTREGLVPGMGSPEILQQSLEAANNARITEGKGEEAPVNPSLPPTVEDVPPEYPPIVKELAEYYKTPRGKHERAPGKFATRSADLLANYDSYAFNYLISPRPLLIIAGADASTKFYSEDAIRAAKQPKELVIIPGRDHAALYDNLTESGPKLVDFFKEHL
ncbi:Alpha/Beta hydrolase protein [Talaromyces proteolyticus]|uniref:Alpha/Beta hydrolase protein n=1 Tax=Talaromyces proteolyticus TaxID=1131652 RepID=A0AAD4KMT2_9EURO|nr:Alpha/Beta hydrolase protein [Talaromyces proteolyticus]KAH8691545.1 Alpha/Beta hydrolase protein [Talaromyces proteolyticus]